MEFCYPTIIQSQTASSGYDLKFTAESTPDNIAYNGVFLVSVGMRYKSYCSSLGRSIMVDPTKVCIVLSIRSSLTFVPGARSNLRTPVQPPNGAHAKATRRCRGPRCLSACYLVYSGEETRAGEEFRQKCWIWCTYLMLLDNRLPTLLVLDRTGIQGFGLSPFWKKYSKGQGKYDLHPFARIPGPR